MIPSNDKARLEDRLARLLSSYEHALKPLTFRTTLYVRDSRVLFLVDLARCLDEYVHS